MIVARMLIAVLVSCLAACAHAPGPVATASDRAVILVGIDGFRADYLDRGLTPRLSRLAVEGVRARGGMMPSFPTVTFPNFYTLATGLHPDRHGLVYNSMEDAALPGRTFTLGNRAEVMDRVWYDGGEPIWVTAERQGVRAGTLFWPGSEAAIRGVRPTFWLPFEQSLPTAGRVNMLLGWLTLPPAERPRLLTLYFDQIDTVGHRSGPDSPELNAALGEVDAAVGRLVDGLAALRIEADLVIVADHGMATTSAERIVRLDDVVDVTALRTPSLGTVGLFDPVAGREAEVAAGLLRPHARMACHRKGELPARLRYGRHPRVPAIVCLPQTGWVIGTRERTEAARVNGGAHGYDNADPSMRALFIAHGPSIRPGTTVTGVESVDVQPLLARLLRIGAPAGDGDPTRFAPALR